MSGGRRQSQRARMDLIPHAALDAMGEALAEGEGKYGRLDSDPTLPNWCGLNLASDQSPVSHAMKHIALLAAGDTSEDHAGHALANLAMISWFMHDERSPYKGMTWPEILAHSYSVNDDRFSCRAAGHDSACICPQDSAVCHHGPET